VKFVVFLASEIYNRQLCSKSVSSDLAGYTTLCEFQQVK